MVFREAVLFFFGRSLFLFFFISYVLCFMLRLVHHVDIHGVIIVYWLLILRYCFIARQHSREVTVALEFRCRSVLSGSGALATSTCSLISRLNLSNFVVAFSVAEDKVHDLDQHCGLSMCTLAPYRDVRDAKLLAAPNPFWSEASRPFFRCLLVANRVMMLCQLGFFTWFGLSVAISYPRSTSARSPSRCILLRSR